MILLLKIELSTEVLIVLLSALIEPAIRFLSWGTKASSNLLYNSIAGVWKRFCQKTYPTVPKQLKLYGNLVCKQIWGLNERGTDVFGCDLESNLSWGKPKKFK